MKLDELYGQRFDTLEQAQEFAGDSHQYYYECEGCGDTHTCRCGKHKDKIIIGSCPTCVQKPEGGVPKGMENTLPSGGGRIGNKKVDEYGPTGGHRTPPMY